MEFFKKLRGLHLWYKRLIIGAIVILAAVCFIVAIYQSWYWMLIPAFALLFLFYIAQAKLWCCPHCGAPLGRLSKWRCDACGKLVYETDKTKK